MFIVVVFVSIVYYLESKDHIKIMPGGYLEAISKEEKIKKSHQGSIQEQCSL